MAKTSLNLDRQADGKIFSFGTASASGEALLTLNKGTAALSVVVLDVKASANIAGDLNLVGNLNITGSVNTQTVTNTNVQDLTITVNDGGTTPSDNTSGIIVEGTGNTIAGAFYFNNTSGTKFAFATGGDAVGTSATQTLTNKSISGGQITSAVALATNVTNNANLTGPITSVGNTTSVAAQTGTGSVFVMQASPTLTTPNIGVATGTSLSTSGSQSVGTASSVAGDMIWRNATNAFTQTFRGSNPTADIVYILPTTAPTTGQALTASTPSAGVSTMTWSNVGTGTVTAVSIATANGVSGSSSGGATPALTIVLGAITPTSVNGNIISTGTGTLTLGANTLTVSATASIAGTHTGTSSGNNTGDQTITLTGAVTGSGTGSFATTLAVYHRATVVSGTQDSVNKIFTIANTPMTGSEQVFMNGQLLTPGASNDYVLSATTVTFQVAFSAPTSTDTIRIYATY